MREQQRNKNQSAYPEGQNFYGGLSKLEIFTMHAMQGILANPNTISYENIPQMALKVANEALHLHRGQDEIDFDENGVAS